ncbi:hypothetical protein EV193_105284 [Herbihabitans rhizosphaerae]|uniref:Uncharacterized protein n=1 Tax=Herbihabitans rhizosphaerae TaxID=1872711 RepID=A0A4Q7KN28_9PSEU|nr:DUF6247 family protein [Herbihabitans rhizosphaerae]RZS37726.1 hypothetical protein EV193_105284 [Herbihabitans rhizosphaerae]
MAFPAAVHHGAAPTPPDADPLAIRACLTPDVVAEFDREWEIVLERAKQDKDLRPVHELLGKWRHLAYAELVEPGSYFRTLAVAAHIQATGQPRTGSVSGDDVRAMIDRRLGR